MFQPYYICFRCITHACQAGFFADTVDILLNCGNNSEAEDFARNCDKNEAGNYCGEFESSGDVVFFDQESESDAINTARSACSTSSSSSCTTGCTNALQSIRAKTGCCIYSIFNTSSRNDGLFDSSFWLECGVETVGECERTIAVTPIHNNPVCMETEVSQRVVAAQCSASNNPILDAERKIGGCDDFVEGLIDRCTVNARGEFCALSLNENSTFPGLYCFMDQQGCPANCSMALEAVRGELGCCVNEIINQTTVTVTSQDPISAFLTSYELWNECGVETPPISCRSLLGGSVGLMKALPHDSLATKLLFALTFMVMTVWNM